MLKNYPKIIFALLSACLLNMQAFAEASKTNSDAAPLKVGAIFSNSGWAAIGGQVELYATQMAVDDINSAGGILGRRLEVVYEDNRSDFSKAVAAFHKLANIDKVIALLGPNWAEFGDVVAPLAEEKHLPMLTASAFSWTLTKDRKYIFTLVPDYNAQAQLLAQHIAAQKHKRLVILYSTSIYFEGIHGALETSLKELGSPVYKSFSINPGETDLRSIILRLQSEKADALVALVQEGGDFSNLLRQVRAIGYNPQIYAGDISYDEVLVKDWRQANNVVFFAYTGHSDEIFVRRFRERFKIEPPFTAPKAYDQVFVLKNAIEKCGTDAQKLRQCLADTNYQGVSGHIHFSASGNILDSQEITKLKRVSDGKVEDLKN